MEYWLNFAHWVYAMQTLIAGVIATIVAFLTIRAMRQQIDQQTKFRQIDEDKELKAELNSFAFKIMRYVDEISRMSMHIEELKHNHPAQPDEDFYLIFQPVVSEGVTIPDITASDSYTLSKIQKLNLIDGAFIAERYSKGLLVQMQHYKAVCVKFEESAETISKLKDKGSHLLAAFEFNPNDHPDIVSLLTQKKHQANKIVSQTESAKAYLDGYLLTLNPVLKLYGITQFKLAHFEP